MTNDFNLNKVAEVQSIQVLNINQLANALKPIVLPGETMKVQVLKREGAWPRVAYLDDGTMVVVDGGRKQIGRNVDVTVNSVLQTTAGEWKDFCGNEGRIAVDHPSDRMNLVAGLVEEFSSQRESIALSPWDKNVAEKFLTLFPVPKNSFHSLKPGSEGIRHRSTTV